MDSTHLLWTQIAACGCTLLFRRHALQLVPLARPDRSEDRRDDDKQQIRRKIPRYQVDLRYAYRVAQRDFVGINPNFGWGGIYGRSELAESAADQYRVGQAVTVYYDPQHPANSVLEPSARAGTYAPLVFGTISAIVGAALLSVFLSVGFY